MSSIIKMIRSKLRYKFAIIYLLIFVLQCSIFIYIYQINSLEKKRSFLQENLSLLQQANSNFLSILISTVDKDINESFSNTVFWQPIPVNTYAEDFQIYSVMSTLLNTNDVNSIYLYFEGNNKTYIINKLSRIDIPQSSNSIIQMNKKPSNELWFKGAMASNGNLYISKINSTSKAQQPKLSLSKALFDPLTHKLISVVSVNIDYTLFNKLSHELTTTGGTLAIMTHQGDLLYSSDPIHNQSFGTSLLNKMKTSKNTWFDTVWNGKNSTVIYNNSHYPDWYMIKIIPKSLIVDTIRRDLFSNLVISLIVLTVGFIVLSGMMVNVTNHIQHLVKVIKKFKNGNMESRFLKNSRDDEIGQLVENFNEMAHEISNLITLEYKAKIREKEARLEALHAQINPHFLYNTLQTVSSIASKKGDNEIQLINKALSLILRYSLNNTNKYVPLERELFIIEQFMLIQRFRYGDRLNFHMEYSQELNNCLIPIFTLQILVENSIKYGIEQKPGMGEISIKIKETNEGRFKIVVEDNGIGMIDKKLQEINGNINAEADVMDDALGRGLRNLNNRIQYYFGNEFGIKIYSEYSKNTKVFIELPITNYRIKVV